MKVVNENDIIVIYLSKEIKTININDFEDFFEQLFIKLKKIYKINLNGFYLIDVYIDKYYGLVIKIEKEDLDYIEYCDNQIDMRVIFHDVEFLYQIDDYIKNINGKYILINQKLYFKLKENIDNIKFGKLLEATNDIKI